MSTELLKELVSSTMRYGISIDDIPDKYLRPLLNLSYSVMGLAGEAGELSNKVKKLIRDKGGDLSDSDRRDIAKELGDVLWYAGAISKEIGYDIDEIIRINHDKLTSRLERGKIGGSGDNR